ncbi:hypothetical protein ADIS_4355 [Lunatimonas lonarensis]|uniref:Uncharacterized protein n=1 Tax=Lunatimonas lonarensis TaxID=1232681 RepID=R7ZME9_9BACT|nr:hypothetical protein [Lunatimonas lonarensis]EON75184.1 hypothetical protein ADIS_4355 [Lunatimonas lonarensis]
MIQKLFPLDKNYILRQAQTSAEDEGIALMVAELRHAYTLLHNPLQLMDDTYVQILSNKAFPKDSIAVIYRQLSGIYRYRFGSNQLEILFDGRSHLEKYQEDWLEQLRLWSCELGMQESYVKTMLRMSLLYDTESRAVFAENRCKSLINDYFSLKIVKRKGDLVLKMA